MEWKHMPDHIHSKINSSGLISNLPGQALALIQLTEITFDLRN